MEMQNTECTERDRLLEESKQATLTSVAQDARARAAAALSSPTDFAREEEKARAAEQAMGKASVTLTEHRRRHGC
ncbi:MAG: hypothetical protein DMG22_02800 [Acidobacteria bacterium]|nr:MAG: hypothetical protein DMG22_02800 [Acidobacteriota bacterium]